MEISYGIPNMLPFLMNHGELTVTPEELSAKAADVRGANKDLQESFERMRTLFAQTANYWKGEAAEAHREAYNKKLPSIDEILARYEEHVVDLEKMAGVYQEAEVKATNLADELVASTL